MTKIGHVTCPAEHLARALADEIAARGATAGASDEDRTNAETATILLQIAEKKSGLVDRTTYDALQAEIAEWSKKAEARILDVARSGVPRTEIDQAMQRLVAEGDAKQRNMQAWLKRRGEAAWEEVVRDLQRLLGISNAPQPY